MMAAGISLFSMEFGFSVHFIGTRTNISGSLCDFCVVLGAERLHEAGSLGQGKLPDMLKGRKFVGALEV